MRPISLLAAIAVMTVMPAKAENNSFDIHLKKSGAPIQSTMYGIFFEDINYAADGGLYAELVKNRSFEFPNALQGWKIFGNVQVLDDGPFERNPHYVRLSDPGHAHKHTGLDNEGFFGIGIKRGQTYNFSVWARADRPVTLRVELVNTASMGENHYVCQQRLTVNGLKKKAVMKALKRVDLSSDKLYEDNSIDAPTNIVPVENAFEGNGQSIQAAISPLSFSIFILTVQ